MKKRSGTFLKNLIWVVKSLYSVDKKYLFISSISVVIKGISSPISLIILQKIVNLIQLKSKDFRVILFYIAIYLFVDLLNNVYDSLIGYYNKKFNMKFELQFTQNLLKKLPRLSLSDFENSKTYDVINKAQYGGGSKIIFYYSYYISIVTQGVTLVSYLVILLTFKIWIVAIILIIPVIRYFISNYFNIKNFNIIMNRTNEQRKTWYINYLLTYGNFYKELKTFNLFNYFIEQYKEYIKKFNIEDLKLAKASALIFFVLSLFELLIDGGLFCFCIIMGVNGEILLGNVITYTRTIMNSKSTISSILTNASNITKEGLFIDELLAYFNLPQEDNKDKIVIDRISNIRLVNISYKYPNSKNFVLKNITLNLDNNKKIALLGINGSGKTTLIKIIMGFYNDYTGEIYINGINLKKINKDSMLNRISTLFQDFVKYEATFRENIGYSNFDIINNDEKLYEIANKFQLDMVINKNTNKLETQLGSWFDMGINLSIGQWQKVALSRAFAKKSDLYILDEPNAAMDSITEYEISKLYKELLYDKLGIIIAHKISNIVKAVDEIIVLQDGMILESGSHDELIIKDGLYSKLYNLK